MNRLRTASALLPIVAIAANAQDQLRSLSDSIEALSKRVNGAVVQVFATGYTLGGDEESGGATTAGLVTKQRSSGSGVVVSPEGYIITNNHVVQNARRVRVQISSEPQDRATGPASLMRGKLLVLLCY